MRHVLAFQRHLMIAAVITFASAGCGHPTASTGSGGSNASGSGGNNSSGSGGNNANGSGGNNSSGSGGNNSSGSGGDNTPGSGGSGTTGSGGTGTTGSGGTGTTGSGGTGTTGSGGAPVMKMACGDATLPADPKMPGYPADKHAMYNTMARNLMANMSAPEKADQLRGTPQPAIPSTGPPPGYYDDIFRQTDNTASAHPIKGFRFRDGPRGVNLDAPINGGSRGGRSTVFPVPAARGATFDMDLEYQIGQAMGDEMVAAGQTMLLAPTTNILRHPLWGRSQETYGEDVFHLGRLGTASVAGIQEYVPACAKHYAANNIENMRAMQNASMDERTLRETYARHFEMMIKDGGVACVMAAYNPVTVGGSTASCSQNKHLLTDILRTDFGFTGFVMTDWWALSANSSTQTGVSATAAAGINAGLDMELPMSIHYKLLESLVTAGTITQTKVDDAAARILAQKFRFNVVTGTGLKSSSSTYAGGSIRSQPHIDLAEKAARESMVLLKNANNTLPLKKMGKIAVIGTRETYSLAAGSSTGPGINNPADDINKGTVDFATGVRVGDVGSSRVDFDPAAAISPFAGIQMAGTGATVTSGNTVPAGMDFYVVVVGLTPYDEGEEYNRSGDRATLALNGKINSGMQNNLVMQAVATGKPVIVVVEAGGVVDMPWRDSVQAIVMAWYPGMVGGKALGALLFGDANFSGKLPVTWPNALSEFPTPFASGNMTTTMDYALGYRYFESKGTKPLYPFGYGLSYSGKFRYDNLVVPCSTAKAPSGTATGSVINVQFNVTNTGTVKGDEVALLFVSFPNVAKQLKGFVRVAGIDAGKTVSATIPVRVSDLKYWDSASNGWKYPSGAVKIMVGSSSADADLTLTDNVTVN